MRAAKQGPLRSVTPAVTFCARCIRYCCRIRSADSGATWASTGLCVLIFAAPSSALDAGLMLHKHGLLNQERALMRHQLGMILFALSLALLTTLTPSVTAQPATTTAVLGELAQSLTVSGNRLVWHQGYSCDGNSPDPGTVLESKSVTFFRVRTDGGDTRPIYERILLGSCPTDPTRSPIVADERYVYWLTTGGLVRLSVEANPGDQPEVLNANLGGEERGQLAITDEYIYGYKGVHLFRIPKAGPYAGEALAGGDAFFSNLQVRGNYLYYILDGRLYRRTIDTGATIPLANNVATYYAEGFRRACLTCLRTDYVYIAQNHQVGIYNTITGTYAAPLYTSPDREADVRHISGSATHIFIMEERCDPDGGLCRNRSHLVRTSRALENPGTLYVSDAAASPTSLSTDATFVYWIDGLFSRRLRRLPLNAAALPVINLYMTGIEVTQGIQTATNSVVLVQNKRTFVRVFARASSANPVPNVAMELYVRGASGAGARVAPINAVGKHLRLSPAPDPLQIDQSFLFEVPFHLTKERSLRFTAVLNPQRFPLEPDYADNLLESQVFVLEPSPPLMVQFVSFNYTIGNQTYRPRLLEDVLYNADYIRRTYPLASTVGSFGERTPGLRTNWWSVHDEGLGARILQRGPNNTAFVVASECNKAPFYYQQKQADGSTKLIDDRNMCASSYIHAKMWLMRHGRMSDQVLMYGMIAEGGGGVRGFATRANIASGPASDRVKGYYAAHEIAHLLGRDHPGAGSGPKPQGCDHDSVDRNYPYTSSAPARAPIGPLDGSVRGFTPFVDPPPSPPGSPKPPSFRVIGPDANDYMSYCGSYWISDYTYRGLYNELKSIAPANVLAAEPALAGPGFSVGGVLNPAGAAIHDLQLLDAAEPTPASPTARFAVRLLAVDGRTLAEHGLPAGEIADAEELLPFAVVVPADPQTRTVQIVDRQESRTLAAAPVSASAPSVGNLQLSGPAELSWMASDPDGDQLRFDLFWSRDGGMSFVPVLLGLEATRATVDTSVLGGGAGLFRVVAHDGAHTAEVLSPPVTLAVKPPIVQIAAPLDGVQVEWNQLVTFQASAFDLQDGPLAEAGLVWTDEDGAVLGTGELFATDRLPVGSNRISLTATNSLGLSTSTTVMVQVGDSLDPLGPTLSVTPPVVELVATGDAPAPQTLQVWVSNVGGGVLSWEASSNQPWLTLDSTSGTEGATVTISVTPADIPLGESATAIITWSTIGASPAHALQTQVRVDRFNPILGVDPPAGGSGASRLYLPLLRR